MLPDQYGNFIETNRDLWNAKTPIHADSDFYDLKGFESGKTSLRKIELQEMGSVNGKSLLHLQCHFGLDTMSWARKGAEVTGVDLSEEAIKLAKNLSDQCSIPADFHVRDIMQMGVMDNGPFDIVFTSYGTITWLPNIDKWAQVISKNLKPGGSFYMAEFHPFIWLLDEEKFEDIKYPYFHSDEPLSDVEEGTYADKNAPIKRKAYYWIWTIGDIINALTNAGLKLMFFNEHSFSTYPIFGEMDQIDEQKWVSKKYGTNIPYVFSVKAIKPL